MRILTTGLVLCLVLGSGVAAHPPPQHDPSNGTAGGKRTYWSGDDDSGGGESPMGQVAAASDLWFTTPPAAVSVWNREAADELESTDVEHSRYPPDAATANGAYLRDVAVDVFTSQPSTVVHRSAGETARFVGSDGEVQGWVDYRVALPPDRSRENTTTTWSIHRHEISEVRLLVDGSEVDVMDGGHRPILEFADLETTDEKLRSLSLEATAEVTVVNTTTRQRETCYSVGTRPVCTEYETQSETSHSEEVTASKTVAVHVYDLDPSVRAVRANGSRRGIVVSTSAPFGGVSVGSEYIDGGWRFFSMRNPRWDRRVLASADGSRIVTGTVHPLQVHAYPSPSREAASVTERGERIHRSGETRAPPQLPQSVDLARPTESYESIRTVGIPAGALDDDTEAVTVQGLVNGSNQTVRIQQSRSLNPTQIEVEQVRIANGSVHLHFTLLIASSGRAIDTSSRQGALRVAGATVQTNSSGVAIAEVPIGRDPVVVAFEPAPWWDDDAAYLASRRVVQVGHTGQWFAGEATAISILASVGLLAVFLDRVTGVRLWPPWRGL